MKTSSEERVRNYERDMPRSAPGWLREWAEAREWPENALLFKCDWLRDPMTGIRSKAARCRCTACGEDFWLDWVSGGQCRYGGAGGIRLWEEGKPREITDWNSCRCPECGEEVKARHLRSGAEYAGETAYPMTLHRIPVEGEKDRLALVCWQAVKYFDGTGARHFRFHPYEAMVAEETKLKRVTFHGGGFGGVYWLEGPHQCRSLQDMMQDITEIVCPEGIGKAAEGTTCENAKLEIYLEAGRVNFPAAWVRLWQKRGGKAESLLTCGAGGIVGNLIGQEKLNTRATNYYTARTVYNSAFPQLKALDWKGRRPWEILRMRGKDELREAIALQGRANLGGKTWQAWLEGRKAGKPWTLADAEALEGMEHPERITATEISPAKAARYLAGQRRRWPEDKADEVMLTDYWTMAREAAGTGGRIATSASPPRNDGEMWPERLRREHDRAVGRLKKAENAERDRKIAAVAETLEKYSLTLDGITIRPARSTGELEAEGKILNHCVGSYAERVAAGETFIFFIRREEKPDISWYTLNLDKDRRRVIQNRGRRNCDRTPEIEAFEQTWLAWVRAGARRDKAGAPVIPERNAEKTKEDAA
ncbi:MAG: PcfJ domain-containing protein [Oscillospiraceae bacterium]|nr:PcfJ domain-containing protein [Oscillospiraceae bacterium]